MAGKSGLGGLLPDEVWRALLTAGTAKIFSIGEFLVRQGDPGSHVLVLTSGNVKVTRIEIDGRELLLAIRGPGEVIGEIAVMDGTVRSANVTALGTCVTYMLAADRFRQIIGGFRAEGMLLRHALARYREAEEARAELAELPAGDRVTRVLIRLATAIGGTTPALDVSQHELAGAAGVSRALLAAELAKLRRRGVVTTARRRLVIRDLHALRSAAGHA